jgi:tRNA1Val (adenine37-N6)-methyltransferase
VANSYFQFKQFRVEQGECAMKVSTDACVLGAVADLTAAQRILDIGTGTGLLALMAAQRNPAAHIDAVELDAAAAAQAAHNFGVSPWANRLTVHAVSLGQYNATQPLPYDHIICNPPFFRHSLRSPDAQRTTARHTTSDSLTFQELAEFVVRFLHPLGHLTVLLPPPEMQHFEREASRVGLYPSFQLVIHHRPGSKPLRHITTFSKSAAALNSKDLFLHEGATEAYSVQFQKLLEPFYLAL